MKTNIVCLLLAAALFLPASTVHALDLDAEIVGVYTDSTFATLVGDFAADGNNATATLAGGQGIQISVDVANASAAQIASLFATLIHQGNQVSFIGGSAVAEVLVGGPVFAPTSLGRVANPAIKLNSPNQNGDAGDVWVQGAAFAGTGTDGTGPDNGAVTLFYTVNAGIGGGDEVLFDWAETTGDTIGAPAGQPAIVVNFLDTGINVPEPGSMAMGLATLMTLGVIRQTRRRA